jgi:uncharacterized protein (DUF952 family)
MIYHFCRRSEFTSDAELYVNETLATQGFIHCSPRDHVHVPATLRARGEPDLVVLEIDEKRLPKPPVWEDGDPPDPDGRLFPHVYGPIPTAAVVAVHELPPRPDGSFAPL